MNIKEIYENKFNENLKIKDNNNDNNDNFYNMNYVQSAGKKQKDNIISLFDDLNINNVNDIESEGNNNWFKQPLNGRLSKRTDNKDILNNEIPNKNNKAKKIKLCILKKIQIMKAPMKKRNHKRNLRKLDG